MDDHLKHTLDGASLIVVLGTIVNILPAIAALVSIVWGLIRIYETETIQKIVRKVHAWFHN